MRSTGEVMGIDYDFASSYAKAQIAAGQKLPTSGEGAGRGARGVGRVELHACRWRFRLTSLQRRRQTTPPPALFTHAPQYIQLIHPLPGKVFISMTDKYKPFIVPVAQELSKLGFELVATRGTALALQANGVKCQQVFKISEGR
jgi:hypothetical protein